MSIYFILFKKKNFLNFRECLKESDTNWSATARQAEHNRQ